MSDHGVTDLMLGMAEAAPGPVLPKALTGIWGLDEITQGGLPRGRCTLITGGAGCGKTLLGLRFLVAGAREYGEPGVLVTFRGGSSRRSLPMSPRWASILTGCSGTGCWSCMRSGGPSRRGCRDGGVRLRAVVLAAGRRDQAHRGQAGCPRHDRSGCSTCCNSQGIVRAELVRLFRWLKDRAVTVVVTGERSENDPRTRHGIEQYVSDCVIALDHSTPG